MTRFINLLLTTTLASAAPVTLNFSAQGAGGGLGDSSGIELPPGSLVLVGTFGITPSEVDTRGDNQFSLLESFTVLGKASIGSFNGTPMSFPGAFSASTTVEGATFGGQRVYLWIFNSSQISTADSHLIVSASSWIIPPFGSITCSTPDIDPESSADLFVGTVDSEISSPTLGGPLLQANSLAHPDGSDNDGDGRDALVEWATGTDPATSDRIHFNFTPGELAFNRLADTAGTATEFSNSLVNYVLETSSTLGGWEPFDSEEIQDVSPSNHPTTPGIETVTLTFPPDQGPRRFWRLNVTRKDP